jgi:hypothetical protein
MYQPSSSSPSSLRPQLEDASALTSLRHQLSAQALHYRHRQCWSTTRHLQHADSADSLALALALALALRVARLPLPLLLPLPLRLPLPLPQFSVEQD